MKIKEQNTVGIRELKQRLSYYVKTARGGQRISISDRGKTVAFLTPAKPIKTIRDPELEALLKSGTVRWSGRKPTLPIPIKIKGGLMSDTVLEDRR